MPIKSSLPLESLRAQFAEHLHENVVLANYTTAHVGGPADALLPVNTIAELEQAVLKLWELQVPMTILGSGSNILVSDKGLHGVIVLNRARNIKIDSRHTPPSVWAESGANLGHMARQVALRGLSSLEWAATIPGSVGGAVYGNAGAHGGDIHGNLILAEILHPTLGKEVWPVERLAYEYRSSLLKRDHIPAVILTARLRLEPGIPSEVRSKMASFSEHRRRTQPPGATMGSMFKNPPGDFAGRLIEAAGLKGKSIGGAEISPIHANFFVNHGSATAADIYKLVQLARHCVADRFGVQLELEIELLGEFNGNGNE